MKVCSSCHSRFLGGETFCPHDGTKLVEARDLSPGELTGSSLDDVVRLDKLVWSDSFAERYTGRLLDSRRSVFVTVFNQQFVPDKEAMNRVETARAKVGSPLPGQINTLLQVHLDKNPPYVIESEPRGPSVRDLLDERRQLEWQDAVRLTANLARAAQWLHENGIAHCAFHPGSIFITKLTEGHVIVGDWAIEATLTPDSAERMLEENPSSFAGYVDYMAPEVAASADLADIRSAVYALGCLLYEMVLGKPPLPGKSAAEVLKRHQHEKPIRLSIARGGGDLPSELDDILDMMLAKDPAKRFQAPMAIIAALSNLVDDSPDELAPPLERAEEDDEDDLYRTIDMDSVDRDEVLGIGQKTEQGVNISDEQREELEQAAAKLGASGAVSGTSETRDAVDPDDLRDTAETRPVEEENLRSTGKIAGPAATHDDDDEGESNLGDQKVQRDEEEEEEEKPAAKKTLLFGSLSDAIPSSDETEPVPTDDEGRKQTLLMGGGVSAGTEGAEAAEEDAVDDARKPTLLMGSGSGFDRDSAQSGIVRKQTIGKVDSKPNGEDVHAESDPDSLQTLSRSDISRELDVVDPEAPPTDETVQVQVDGDKLDADRELAARSSASKEDATLSADEDGDEKGDEKGEGEGAEEDEAASSYDVPDKAATSSARERAKAFSDSNDNTREIDRSDWFAAASDDAWDASLALEHQESTERRNKAIVLGLASGLALLAVGLFVYFEWIYSPEDPTVISEVEETVADVPPDSPKVDVAAIRKAFDNTLEGGRVVSPVGNSALGHLRELQRHAADEHIYEEARQRFVEVAREKAKEADSSGDLRAARALAGYASQFAPDDAELAKLTADLQARFTGITPDAGLASDEGNQDAGASDDQAEQAEQKEQEATQEQKPAAVAAKPKPKPKPAAKPKPRPRPAKTVDYTGEARAAHTRGNLDEARKLYHQALEQQPRSGEVLAGIGKVYFDQAKYRDAVKYQTKAVRYAPGRNDYRISLGQSYYRLRKYEAAISVWEKVLQRDPNNSVAKQYVTLAQRKLGN